MVVRLDSIDLRARTVLFYVRDGIQIEEQLLVPHPDVELVSIIENRDRTYIVKWAGGTAIAVEPPAPSWPA